MWCTVHTYTTSGDKTCFLLFKHIYSHDSANVSKIAAEANWLHKGFHILDIRLLTRQYVVNLNILEMTDTI